ncbi:acyl-CoA synthetase [Nocardia gipuzkoensis]|uniref:acyl-CoA synthetase n=1 Tax=Nocardia gipuzkoensis TaxID=2749991 RepID=UPI0015EE6031|nr:acyl-CoA synthetase [Nocardia gipuzkoensis]
MKSIATLADIEALEQQEPLTNLNLPASTYEMIQRGAAIDPQAPALSFFFTFADHRTPRTWTYAELLANITMTANAFTELGADRDTVIAYILPNLPETHFVIWGAQAAGIVFSVNPMLDGHTMGELLRAAGTRIVVTLAPFPGSDLSWKVSEAITGVESIEHLVLVDLATYVSLPADESAGNEGRAGVNLGAAGVAVHDFARLIGSQSDQRLISGRRIDPEDFSSFFCTGGTTGMPKIAMRRHRNEVANVDSAMRMISGAIGPGKNLFCGLPLFHVNGVQVTGLAPFSAGAHVVLGTAEGYRGAGVVEGFWDIVANHRIHFFSGVPTLYATLLQLPTTGYDISSLEYGLCGAAPLPVEVMRRFEESTGTRILEGYGLTEGTCTSSSNPPGGERRTGSIGLRLPYQQMRAAILNQDGDYVRDCEVDEVGVLIIRGPNVFAGYRVKTHNVGLWVFRDNQAWLNTGDLGRQDTDGYFWLTGRKKELIIRGGHNIDPLQIEEPLYAHPAVQYAAAVGRPDAHSGELPVAYVQLKPNHTVTENDLLDYAAAQIGERAARPKLIRVISDMPLTAVGKIFKLALVDREVVDALTVALRDAGVPPLEVRVDRDNRGTQSVTVHLAPETSADVAKQVLGAFAFTIIIAVQK